MEESKAGLSAEFGIGREAVREGLAGAGMSWGPRPDAAGPGIGGLPMVKDVPEGTADKLCRQVRDVLIELLSRRAGGHLYSSVDGFRITPIGRRVGFE